ncbi:MAG: AarF/UbiB family protein, partial [Thiothrix sp.]
PKGVEIRPLLEEAKRQLHAEADYALEASYIKRYQALLTGEQDFLLPQVYDDFTTTNILAMSYVGGAPVEQLAYRPQAERDRVMTLLLRLLFREIFEFRLVQTDPNFANYRYDCDTQQLVLLDFGATREYPEAVAEGYRQVMQGAIRQDYALMDAGATQIGFFQAYIKPEQRTAVLALFAQACEPLRYQGVYDFGTSNLAARIRDAGMALSAEQDYWHTPPADALFFHRKLGGLYLLAAKLRARVDVANLFAQVCA